MLVKKRITTKSGVSTFIEKLQNESWDHIMNNTDVNESFNLFFNTFLIIFESCFPMQYVSNKCLIINGLQRELEYLVNAKKYLYIMSKITSCSKFNEYYVRYCAMLRKVIRKAKEMYYNEMLTSSTNKPKMSWKIINNEIGHVYNEKFSQTEFRNGNETINVKKAAKSFKKYFINSVDKLITLYPKNESALLSLREAFPCDFHQIINIPITLAEVVFSISSLRNKNSSGYDGLSNKILKLCGSQISKPLTYIYNLSLNSGLCPDRLKYANIKPCVKKDDRLQINYRPISLLTGFSKIFEMLIFSRLKQHLVSNSILVLEQYGFRVGVTENVPRHVFRLSSYLETTY
jgi:hypothetical protein